MSLEEAEKRVTLQDLERLLERQSQLLYDILGLVNLLATFELGGKGVRQGGEGR